jgi:membrane associated rhomboid family serine protease
MRRAPSPYAPSFSFGPGPVTFAVKVILIANIAIYVLTLLAPYLLRWFGLQPQAIFEQGRIWQPVTYMFLHHRDPFHVLFNMLGIWMFGVQLERLWGTPFFVRYYFVTGVGAALTTIVVGLLPFAFANEVYYAITIGASGALYGLLFAFAYYYPDRPILMFLLFPIPAKYFVMILGGIAFLSSISGGSTIAHATHLGGLVVGFIYLKSYGKGGRGGGLLAELKYRWVKWKMNRMRARFDVHSGGRDRTVH